MFLRFPSLPFRVDAMAQFYGSDKAVDVRTVEKRNVSYTTPLTEV